MGNPGKYTSEHQYTHAQTVSLTSHQYQQRTATKSYVFGVSIHNNKRQCQRANCGARRHCALFSVCIRESDENAVGLRHEENCKGNRPHRTRWERKSCCPFCATSESLLKWDVFGGDVGEDVENSELGFRKGLNFL